MSAQARSSSERLVKFSDALKFITEESPELGERQIKQKAKVFYQLLFHAATRGQLDLRFFCNQCSKRMDVSPKAVNVCRCVGRLLDGEWLYPTGSPKDVAARWEVSVTSVKDLSNAQIDVFHVQTAARIHKFIEYLKAKS